MSASEAIKEAMEREGLGQVDLLDILGTRARVSEVVNGVRAVPKSKAAALASRLGLPLDYLLQPRGRVLDSDGVEVTSGCTVAFSYGIPPRGVSAPVVSRKGKLIAITEGHNPSECPVSELREHVGCFHVIEPK
jgi:transcriptional regulator with XRE-family HTH domain